VTDEITPASVEAKCEGGDLHLGEGLLVLVERALDRLAAGGTLAVHATEPSLAHDLPAWCRKAGHEYLGEAASTHRIRRGTALRLNVREPADWGLRAPLRNGVVLEQRDVRLGRASAIPEHADNATGFAPRGAVVEAGAPAYGFTITDRDRVWADEAAELYQQGTASAWDAARDIPWAQLEPLPEELEEAVCQIMTFLAENELSALYVPAKFVPRIHPAFIEVVLFLAQQSAEEARHYEAFTKRAVANGGGLRYSAASGQLSLKTLFEQEDLAAACFLLSVLGEGTFVDLLRFVETHAPDPVTREIVRRARVDETRHVHFGVAHTRHFLGSSPGAEAELLLATRARAGSLAAVTSVSPVVLDALTVLAAGGLEPRAIREGARAVRELHAVMHANRVKRLVSCGFRPELASELSSLHTSNFM
jgi:hypothetical protein